MVEQDRSPGQTLTLKVTNSTGLLEDVWILALKVLHLKKPLLMEKPTQKMTGASVNSMQLIDD